MSGSQLLKKLVNEKLTSAAEEIIVLFEKTIFEYQEEVVRCRSEIKHLKQQIDQLSDAKYEGKIFKADTQCVSQELLASLQFCDSKEEETPVLVETQIQECPQVKEEQDDECISPNIEADPSVKAEFRLPKSEPRTTCEFLPSIDVATVSANESREDRWRDSEGSSSPGPQLAEEPRNFCVLKAQDAVNHTVLNEWTAPLSFSDTLHTQLLQPGPSFMKTQNSWISKFEIPWEKLPASLLQAITTGTKACPADKRAMVRAVVSAMQEHCPNPNKAACIEVAKMILSKYPVTFADATADGGLFGKSMLTLVYKLKTRIENVNRSKWKRK